MENFILSALILLCTVLAVGFVYMPVFRMRQGPLGSERPALWPRYQQIAQEREILIENLKDLEVDQQMAKLNPEDYQRMRSELYQELEEKSRQLEAMENTEPLFLEIKRDLERMETSSE